nr:GNAT family N-acetyltransferase [Streptomyces sp. SID13031]
MTPEDRSFEQHLENFGLVRIEPLLPERDLDLIHAWVTADRATFWGMADQAREEILATYKFLDSVPTHHAYLIRLDDEPVALLHTYDPQADPAGTAYQIEPGDLGVHFLIAPGDRRQNFTGNLLNALGNFLLHHQGHPRVIADPDATNAKAIDRLTRAGFTLGPEVTFTQHNGIPKTARLAFLTRQTFTQQA